MTKDMLTHMLELQNELQIKAYMESPGEFESSEERIQFIKDMILALTDELHEMLGEVGWKPWATSNHINEDAFKNELVDAWHFMMNLMLVVNMSANELYARYLAKREKNIKRQKDGYDGLNKCPICKRAYDDDAVDCTQNGGDVHPYCAQRMQVITSDMI
jgi:CRISPR/Cas system-associated protein Cas10 (large subunit of type III CRISPR-Cas system)